MTPSVQSSPELPPLPAIKSGTTLRQIFTHRSLARRSKRAFEDSPNDPSPDNEHAVLYGLHERLVVQVAQADKVKGSPNAQAEVFKAYVGGLYREQGLDTVSKWLCSFLQVYAQDAYENIRREHLLPPVQTPAPQALSSDQ
ncbi:hypothetical protein B0F90DRAFT_1821627 [Multifurca ochricompacta]|uniref:RNase III domain-containing protein n=1 Tax=Multifurca ochricompacta TaxID=376703 RepID=A0AAD4LZF1_9AGAM|nr:hypothetical protein B0F90DRAFT_1821627 [Multifurca ochricompacta]